jgi:hypothetical protein
MHSDPEQVADTLREIAMLRWATQLSGAAQCERGAVRCRARCQ